MQCVVENIVFPLKSVEKEETCESCWVSVSGGGEGTGESLTESLVMPATDPQINSETFMFIMLWSWDPCAELGIKCQFSEKSSAALTRCLRDTWYQRGYHLDSWRSISNNIITMSPSAEGQPLIARIMSRK